MDARTVSRLSGPSGDVSAGAIIAFVSWAGAKGSHVDNQKTTAETAEVTLDLTGLLGAGLVFDAAGDQARQAELIDANCTKIGAETSVRA